MHTKRKEKEKKSEKGMVKTKNIFLHPLHTIQIARLRTPLHPVKSTIVYMHIHLLYLLFHFFTLIVDFKMHHKELQSVQLWVLQQPPRRRRSSETYYMRAQFKRKMPF